MTTINLQVPENALPGDTLSFSVGGQEMEMLIPPGTEPGDTLQIRVGDADENEDSKQKSATISQVDLGEDRSLDICSELPKGKFGVADDTDDSENDGTYSCPWRSSVLIAARWQEIKKHFPSSPTRVLELGAGIGIMGMSYAINGLPSETTTITLTDLAAALPLLVHNIERNQAMIPTKLRTRPLRWSLERNENDWTNNEPPFDCILGSDLLYNAEHIPHLVATMKRLLHPTRGFVVLSVRWRKPELERDFFQNIDLDWTLITSVEFGCCCELSWQEFGDPSSDASNKYNHQTQISVNGKQKSLADITEEEAQDLSAAEFQAWEDAYIQIYIGKPKEQK